MGQMGDGDQLERAFVGETLPLSAFFSPLRLPLDVECTYQAYHKERDPKDGEEWEGPVKKIVSPLAAKIIKANKKVTTAVAKGESCDDFYPIECDDRVVSAETCSVALIACDSDSNTCPAFSQDASQKDEIVTGAVCFVLAVFILFICLLGIVAVLKKMPLGVSSRIIYKVRDSQKCLP